jgi:hypothetical protein
MTNTYTLPLKAMEELLNRVNIKNKKVEDCSVILASL